MKAAVIMAGGSGTRFWPKSSKKHPKQFLALTGEDSLLQMTWKRLDGLVDKKNRWIVTTSTLTSGTKRQLGKSTKLIVEPEGRNTMAAVCLSVWQIHKKNPDGLIAILPADAHVGNAEAYREALSRAFEIAQKHDRIVCLGMKPTSPSTGFGYIESGAEFAPTLGGFDIKRFVEKPNEAKAQEYFYSGKYFWNAGIFVFKAKVFVEETRTHAPEFANSFDQIAKQPTKLKAIYKTLPKMPIDIALMEKTTKGAVFPADFGWNDVGSWTALTDVKEPNHEAGLIQAPGGFEAIASQGLIVDATKKKFVGVIGVKDLLVVETEDALLICSKDRAQDIKDLVALIDKNPKLKDKLL